MKEYLYSIFCTSLSEMTFLKLLVAIAISLVAGCFALYVIKVLKYIFKGTKKVAYNACHFSKIRCSRVQCPYCGRTLDKCNCTANQGLSYRKRIKRYKKTRK